MSEWEFPPGGFEGKDNFAAGNYSQAIGDHTSGDSGDRCWLGLLGAAVADGEHDCCNYPDHHVPFRDEKPFSGVHSARIRVSRHVVVFGSLFSGGVRGNYLRFWGWDLALHTAYGVLLGIVGFLLDYVLNEKEAWVSTVQRHRWANRGESLLACGGHS